MSILSSSKRTRDRGASGYQKPSKQGAPGKGRLRGRSGGGQAGRSSAHASPAQSGEGITFRTAPLTTGQAVFVRPDSPLATGSTLTGLIRGPMRGELATFVEMPFTWSSYGDNPLPLFRVGEIPDAAYGVVPPSDSFATESDFGRPANPADGIYEITVSGGLGDNRSVSTRFDDHFQVAEYSVEEEHKIDGIRVASSDRLEQLAAELQSLQQAAQLSPNINGFLALSLGFIDQSGDAIDTVPQAYKEQIGAEYRAARQSSGFYYDPSMQGMKGLRDSPAFRLGQLLIEIAPGVCDVANAFPLAHDIIETHLLSLRHPNNPQLQISLRQDLAQRGLNLATFFIGAIPVLTELLEAVLAKLATEAIGMLRTGAGTQTPGPGSIKNSFRTTAEPRSIAGSDHQTATARGSYYVDELDGPTTEFSRGF